MARQRKFSRCAWAMLASAVLATAPVGAARSESSPKPKPVFKMKFGTGTVAGDQNEWMKRFKLAVETRSTGRLKIELYPGGQIGSIPRMISGIQSGALEGWIGSSAFLVGLDRRFQVTETPGIFHNIGHAQRTVADPEFRNVYLALGSKRGISGVSLYASQTVAIVTRTHPIRRVADFKGLKIRVLATRMETETLRRLGASPVPMALLKVLPALQRGDIDGVKDAMVMFVPFKYWNTARHLTETGESTIVAGAFLSQEWLTRLPRELRRMVIEEAARLDGPIHKYAVEFGKGLRQIWLANRGEIHELPPEEKNKLMHRLASVGSKIVANQTDVTPVYNLLTRVANRHR